MPPSGSSTGPAWWSSRDGQTRRLVRPHCARMARRRCRGGKRRLCVLGGRGHRLAALTHPDANSNSDRRLVALRDQVLARVPAARLARDQFSRLYDIAIDFAEEEPVLPLSTAQKIEAIFEQGGAHAKISSIHVNAWLGEYDKVSMAIHYLAERFGYDDAHDSASVVFVGDSPNDEPMFAHFPMACGVANLLTYRELVAHLPRFVTSRRSGAGFSEFARYFWTAALPDSPPAQQSSSLYNLPAVCVAVRGSRAGMSHSSRYRRFRCRYSRPADFCLFGREWPGREFATMRASMHAMRSEGTAPADAGSAQKTSAGPLPWQSRPCLHHLGPGRGSMQQRQSFLRRVRGHEPAFLSRARNADMHRRGSRRSAARSPLCRPPAF